MTWATNSRVFNLPAATPTKSAQPERGTFLQIRTADGEGWMEQVLVIGVRRSSSGFRCERCHRPTMKGDSVARTDSFWSEVFAQMCSRYFCMDCVMNGGWRPRERPAMWGRAGRS